MLSSVVQGEREIIAKIQGLGPVAVRICTKRLREGAVLERQAVKAHVPIGETKQLKRSITIKKVKKKRRFTVAFRIVARVIKDTPYYAFAPNYGVRSGRGKQPAHNFMSAGTAQAQSYVPTLLANIKADIREAWRRR